MNSFEKLLITITFLLISVVSIGQTDGGPPPPPICTDNPIEREIGGTGAPLADGTYVVIGLALAYGAFKFHNLRRKSVTEKS